MKLSPKSNKKIWWCKENDIYIVTALFVIIFFDVSWVRSLSELTVSGSIFNVFICNLNLKKKIDFEKATSEVFL